MIRVVLAAMVIAGPVLAADWRAGAGVDVPLRLDGLARQSVRWTDHGKARTCEGVWLTDVLARAGAPVGDKVRGDALTTVVLAEAADGYAVAFSLGETDAKLGAGKLLVADRCDGAVLGADEGPLRIVAAGEARGARSVRQLRTLTLVPIVR